MNPDEGSNQWREELTVVGEEGAGGLGSRCWTSDGETADMPDKEMRGPEADLFGCKIETKRSKLE